MTGERVERRLAAVLAADVAWCSRLVDADEKGTLARLASKIGTKLPTRGVRRYAVAIRGYTGHDADSSIRPLMTQAV